MKHIFLTLLTAAILTAGTSAADKLVCSLTGKTIDSCCCEPAKNGKGLYCTLANKDIKKCCCKGMKHKSV